MNGKGLIAIAFVMCFGLSAMSEAVTVSYTAGLNDSFAAPEDAAGPSADLLALLPHTAAGFDRGANINGGVDNLDIAHTFSAFGGLPGQIVAATLELSVLGGEDEWVHTDLIVLAFAEAVSSSLADATAWTRTLGALGADPGLLTSGLWAAGSTQVVTLDLAALPLALGGTLNLLPQLAANGFLDAIVMDDTAVDYMTLTVTAEPQDIDTEIPEPATVTLLGVGLVGLAMKRRKRRAC